MLNFVFILVTFLEIILTAIIVLIIVQLEKKIISYNEKINLAGAVIIEVCKNTRMTLKNINKFVKIITNENLIKTIQVVRFTITTVQIILLIRSLDLSKGLKSINFKNIKKIMMTELVRRFIRKCVFKYLRSVLEA